MVRRIPHAELFLCLLTLSHRLEESLAGIDEENGDKDDANLDAVEDLAYDGVGGEEGEDGTTHAEREGEDTECVRGE